LVYNRDFVERNFNVLSKGIFTLGEQDIASLAAIATKKAELDAIGDKIDKLNNTLHGADQKSGKKGELVELESQIKDKCWAQKLKHEDAFTDAFKGLRNNSEKFKEHTLTQVSSNVSELKALDYLTEKAKTVFGLTLAIEVAIPALGTTVIIPRIEPDPCQKGHRQRECGHRRADPAIGKQRLGQAPSVLRAEYAYLSILPAAGARRLRGQPCPTTLTRHLSRTPRPSPIYKAITCGMPMRCA
jgi:hypothetical protein